MLSKGRYHQQLVTHRIIAQIIFVHPAISSTSRMPSDYLTEFCSIVSFTSCTPLTNPNNKQILLATVLRSQDSTSYGENI
mmetsp:Transcript_9775/g.36458  ORF Transcript_9775/g.36458 Transcript_9775/m.36458 type:complete len:80 (+) Transcript_9775:588-827(+)